MSLYQEDNCCYRLYIGNGNWINLGQETTRELLAIYAKGVATRFELVPGLAIDILPNDVDCNSKNTDLPMLMRADLVSVDPESANNPGKIFSSYIKDLLEKQGIVDVFPPVRLGEDLPLVTSLPSHRHLSMVPAPIGMSRRSNRPSVVKEARLQDPLRGFVVSSSVSSASTSHSYAPQNDNNNFNGIQPTATGNKKKRGKKGSMPKKATTTSLQSGIMTRSQQRHSKLLEEVEPDHSYGSNTSPGTWIDTAPSSTSLPPAYPLNQTSQQVFLHHRVPSNMYRKDLTVETSSAGAFYSSQNVFKQPSQPIFQQRPIGNYSSVAMHGIQYQNTPEAIPPYHSQALPGLSIFTSSLGSMDCDDDNSGESALRRSNINIYSTLSHPSTMTPIPANWMERDMWNMGTQANIMDASDYGSTQTPSYSHFPMHTPEISYNANNINHENESSSQTGVIVPLQLGVHRYDIETKESPSSISTLGSIPLSSLYNDSSFFKSNEATDCCTTNYQQEEQPKRDSILEHRSMSPKDTPVLAPLTNSVATSRYTSPHHSVISS
ncbi:hypothetical protein F4703DRAFT_1796964 [Phycomyces blakesleeanus]|uniref:Uncharacterized protein n=1 Tax=Phycomyces blakesleeanus (strain ATCC 8743b / DSM 1359 / FGSC 10004 / NBRC 33097 / NRRL 1555) TaxID=763407 RepID=A0A162PK25_PHYB8|nr:hypothetical protein PHYBLDRAFT_172223 [Phycomyces blakesleeanus NRRL 1555(-)]OAD69586.1 hypothetical protein PHYBLDRAFT_172223 [Phycomyces blakesleeanus NRRL 1555(-)]|eukprot:XP_018287626.1 hypothetical protein PHYBLDRAFT_172223 [Phycomyces blakesleeanus NRRL 1555(-)]